eukprot:SAG11_NODE_3061_length_2717_cov_2.912944_2_plen_212_part_00
MEANLQTASKSEMQPRRLFMLALLFCAFERNCDAKDSKKKRGKKQKSRPSNSYAEDLEDEPSNMISRTLDSRTVDELEENSAKLRAPSGMKMRSLEAIHEQIVAQMDGLHKMKNLGGGRAGTAGKGLASAGLLGGSEASADGSGALGMMHAAMTAAASQAASAGGAGGEQIEGFVLDLSSGEVARPKADLVGSWERWCDARPLKHRSSAIF